MQIITLTTDWGNKDFFNGMVKGHLYSNIDNVNLVDITHEIRKFDTLSAAFVVKNACLKFPKNTIHIIDVNSFESCQYAFIVVKARDQFFICTDNGLPSLIFEDIEEEIEIYNTEHIYSDGNFYTFAVWDNFCKIVQIISNTHSLETIGTRIDKFAVEQHSFKHYIDGDTLFCKVIHIDDYGNAYLNITQKKFDEILQGRKGFSISIDRNMVISKIVQSYQETKNKGDALLTISSTGNLELALRESNFSRLLGIEINSTIKINLL